MADEKQTNDQTDPRPAPDDLYGRIVAAKGVLKTRLERVAELRAETQKETETKEKTRLQYLATAARIFKKAGSDPAKIWAEAAMAKGRKAKRNTYATNQSALLWVAAESLKSADKNQDDLQRKAREAGGNAGRANEARKPAATNAAANDAGAKSLLDPGHPDHAAWVGWIQAMERAAEIIRMKPNQDEDNGGKHYEADRPKESKRRGLGKLPPDWRERLYEKMGKWRPIFLGEAVTGCRPEEMMGEKNFHVIADETTMKITIGGAKVSNMAGQPSRDFEWNLGETKSALVQELAARTREAGGEIWISYKAAGLDKLKQVLSSYSHAITTTARRLFATHPERIVPYSLRHAAASDAKQSGLTDLEVSAMMGHAVDTTKWQYGSANARGGNPVTPQSAKGSVPVRIKSKAPDFAAADKGRAKKKAAKKAAKPPKAD